MKIGMADTMFATVDMFSFAKQAVADSKERVSIERYTVPGFKDLPVAAKKLLEEFQCDIVIALGMAGAAEIDGVCAQEASAGLMQVELMTNRHVLKVFVHLDEAKSNGELVEITKNRVYKHTQNAIALLKGKTALSSRAGKGVRQGFSDEGPIE